MTPLKQARRYRQEHNPSASSNSVKPFAARHSANLSYSPVLVVFACAFISLNTAVAQDTDPFRVADKSSPHDSLRSYLDATIELHEMIQANNFRDRHRPEHIAVSQRVLDCIDDSDLP